MKNILTLGAGTGGALIANLLSHRLDLRQWSITVIDRADLHVYQPGLLFIPFGMYGYESEHDVARRIGEPLPRNVTFVAADVKLIDHASRTVETDRGKRRRGIVCADMGTSDGVGGPIARVGTRGAHRWSETRSGGAADA